MKSSLAGSYSTQSIAAGATSFYLPSDFLVDWGLFNTSAGTKLTKCTDDFWETLTGAAEMEYYIIRNGQVLLAAASASDVELSFIYWPTVNTADIEVDDPTRMTGNLMTSLWNTPRYGARTLMKWMSPRTRRC